MKHLLTAAILLTATTATAQQVYIPQRVGTTYTPKNYATPLRNLFFGRYRSTPIIAYKPYQIVQPPARMYQPAPRMIQPPPVMYQPAPRAYQPPSYLVPATQRR